MIAQPLLRNQVSYTDVVTIIEMRDEAIVNPSVYMEPITWELHNKLVFLASNPLSGKGCGNYCPALEEAFKVLNYTDCRDCALLLLFLSDGRPSDASALFRRAKSSHIMAKNKILNAVEQICSRFGHRLTFGAFGFAFDNGIVFNLMEEMVNAAKICGSKGIFSTGLDSVSLRKALYAMSTSLLLTKTDLSSLAGGSLLGPQHTDRILRNDLKRCQSDDSGRDRAIYDGSEIIFDESEYDFYFKGNDYLSHYASVKMTDSSNEFPFLKIPLKHPLAYGVALKKKYFESGAERATFDLTEVDGYRRPIGQPLVGKVNLHYEPSQIEFHKKSSITQQKALRLANVFNKHLVDRKLAIPEVHFLDVSFYTYGVGGSPKNTLALEP